MHDSRGASLKVGDRVLIEAEVTELQSQADENFCCCAVKVIVPEQPGKEKVMSPPVYSAMSTKMLTRVGATCILTFASMTLIASPSTSQESFASRLAQVESNSNALLSITTALKADVDGIKQDVAAIRAEMMAMRKASGIKLAPVANWAGDPQFSATMSTPPASSWASIAAPVVSWGAMAGQGGCANGSCGPGGANGRVGLFRRR